MYLRSSAFRARENITRHGCPIVPPMKTASGMEFEETLQLSSRPPISPGVASFMGSDIRPFSAGGISVCTGAGEGVPPVQEGAGRRLIAPFRSSRSIIRREQRDSILCQVTSQARGTLVHPVSHDCNGPMPRISRGKMRPMPSRLSRTSPQASSDRRDPLAKKRQVQCPVFSNTAG